MRCLFFPLENTQSRRRVQPVAQGHDRVFPDHARSGVAHHGLDLHLVPVLVTVYLASSAGRLFRAEPAARQPRTGIIQ